MERKIYNWKYIFDGVGFDVIPDKETNKPQILYKLYGLNQYSFDSLINQYVYATHPSQFNDIFDCNEDLIDFDDKGIIKTFLKDTIPDDKLNRLITYELDKLKIFVKRNFREMVYKKWGVFSMTANPNNILMWSYYCNHSGFCIEFDISKFPFKYYGPFPINYQSKLEAISIKKNGVQISVIAQSNLKDKIWKHEDEWRLMIAAPDGEEMLSSNFEILKRYGGHDRKFHYPLEAILSIALGNRFFDPDEIKEIDNTTLEINLKNDFAQKSVLLDFIETNNIKTHIGLRKGFTEITFRTTTIKRVSFRKYTIKAL